MRAAVYLRISLDRTGEGAGVNRQREDCLALVDQQGWTLFEVYVDNDISASSGKPRPEYRRMLKAIQSGNVDAVVAWHPDRLYRKLPDLEELIAAVEKHNVVMRTVRAGEIDLSTPTGRMLARILSATAQAEGEIKSDRWKRSVRQKREAGVFAPSGPRMFGWTRDGEVIESEAETIRWIAGEIIHGVGAHTISRKLNDQGTTTTLGNPWQVQSIRALIQNPKLAGYATLNGEIIGKGTWPAILDTDTWETARAIVGRTSRKQPPRVALLAGLVRCGECDAPMVTGARMNKKKNTVRVYRCSRIPGRGGCGKISIQADKVEEIVEAYAKARLDDDRTRAAVVRFLSEPREHSAEITMLETRVTELEHQLDEPGVPVATILRAIDRAKVRLEELLAATAATPRVELPTRGGEWPEDLARRAALVRLVVESVSVAPATRFGLFDSERVKIQRRD